MPVASTAASAASSVVAHAASSVVVHTGGTATTSLTQAVAPIAASAASATPFVSNDAWLNGLATVVGGLMASGVAYFLQLRAAKKKEREQGLVEAHQLMFCLVQQINTILLVWRDHFSKDVDNPARFMSVPACTPFDLDRHVVDVTKMTILLDCAPGRSVLYDLNIAQEAYREALLVINERSRVHREELQPALAKSGLNGKDVTNMVMMAALGPQLLLTMVGLTDGSCTMMHKSFIKLTAVKDKARKYIVERFETDDFTDASFPDTNGIETEPKLHYPQRKEQPRSAPNGFGFGTAHNWGLRWSRSRTRVFFQAQDAIGAKSSPAEQSEDGRPTHSDR